MAIMHFFSLTKDKRALCSTNPVQMCRSVVTCGETASLPTVDQGQHPVPVPVPVPAPPPRMSTTDPQHPQHRGHVSYHHHPHQHTSHSAGKALPSAPSFTQSEGLDHSHFFVIFLKVLCVLLIGLTLPFSLFFCMRVVAEYERAVILRLGRTLKMGTKGPGLFFLIPCLDSVRKIDLRTVTFDVPPQEVLTRDSVTVAVDAVVFYKIFNPTVSVMNVEDADRSTRLLAQTTLRNVLGTKTLAEILSEREEISNMMQESLDAATDVWGVKVERVEMKDVRLPVQLQRAMAAEAEATRESRAKFIAAEGEFKASKALKEAAEVISQSPSALQLRYLQTLSAISAEKNSTIIFPIPLEFLSHFSTDEKHRRDLRSIEDNV